MRIECACKRKRSSNDDSVKLQVAHFVQSFSFIFLTSPDGDDDVPGLLPDF